MDEPPLDELPEEEELREFPEDDGAAFTVTVAEAVPQENDPSSHVSPATVDADTVVFPVLFALKVKVADMVDVPIASKRNELPFAIVTAPPYDTNVRALES